MREQDDELLDETLGLKPKKRRVSGTLDATDMKYLLNKTENFDRGDQDAERIKGLGAAPIRTHDHVPRQLTDIEKEINRLKQGDSLDPAFHSAPSSSANIIQPKVPDSSERDEDESIRDKDRKKSSKTKKSHQKKEHKHKSKKHSRDE